MRRGPARQDTTWTTACGGNIALAWAFGGSFVAVTAAHVLGLPAYVGLLLVAAVTSLSARQGAAPQALAAAVIGWLFVTGFVENRYGELHYSGPGDLWRLALLLSVALASTPPSGRDVSTRAHLWA